MVEEKEPVFILCVGVDRKIHICEPHKDETKCGVKVLKKNISSHEHVTLYSCWECTY